MHVYIFWLQCTVQYSVYSTVTSDQRCGHRTGVGPTLQTTHPAQPSSLAAVAARHPPEKVVKPNSNWALVSIPVNTMRLMDRQDTFYCDKCTGSMTCVRLGAAAGAGWCGGRSGVRHCHCFGCSDSWCSGWPVLSCHHVSAGHTHTSTPVTSTPPQSAARFSVKTVRVFSWREIEDER